MMTRHPVIGEITLSKIVVKMHSHCALRLHVAHANYYYTSLIQLIVTFPHDLPRQIYTSLQNSQKSALHMILMAK